MNGRTSKRYGWAWVPVAFVVLCFGSAAILQFLSPATLRYPGPSAIWSKLIEVFTGQVALTALKDTAVRVIWIMAVSATIGVLIGTLIGQSESRWRICQPVIDFVRSIPVTFFIPPLALLLGSQSDLLVISLVVVPCTLVIVINVRYALSTQQQERVLTFHLVSGRKSDFDRIWHVTIPEIMPFLISGFRISLSYAIVIVTVLEFMRIGSHHRVGLGGMVSDAMQVGDFATAHVIAVCVGAVGLLLNNALEMAERHWR